MLPKITALYASLNAIVMMVLAVLVVRHRWRARVGLGDGGDAALARAVRAHGNNVEYVPYALVLLLLLELGQFPLWALHALGLALTLGRIAHGYGLSRSDRESVGRAAGVIMTWLVMLIAAGMNLWRFAA
jgi:uncharacterized membrane protein YecN with MAPEG domain